MARGGKREGAGGKPTWRHGKTKSIRVPIALAEEILQIARELDEGQISRRNDLEVPLPLKATLDNKAIIEHETESKVLNLSGISIRQHEGGIAVHLEDLVKAGYKIRPEKVAQLVEARIQKLLVDKRLKYGIDILSCLKSGDS